MAALALVAALTLGACQKHEPRQEIGGEASCYVCHQPEYEDLTNEPPHPGLFATTCADCHMSDAWIPAVAINHDWFVLQNRHAELRCSECHTVGYRSGDTSSECVSCHQADYDGATMPPHQGYPTECATCHTDAGWVPSTFDHPWALTGAHALAECTTCHTGTPPQWTGLPTDCVGCHQADYDRAVTTVTEHSTYPTTCQDCHSTTDWDNAIGGAHPNDRFDIMSGRHSGYECTSCHIPERGTSAGGANTDCVNCHTGDHTRAEMDRVGGHQEERDYPPAGGPYAAPFNEVNFCLDCHGDGRKP
jgi:hypothetical protein